MTHETTAWTNGKIYTADEAFSTVDSLVCRGGRIIYAGDRAGAERYIKEGARVEDLRGAVVLPGLNDAHLHFLDVGRAAMRIDAHWKPKDEILSSVREAAVRAGDGEWVLGRGWNHAVWNPPELPTRRELDEASPDHPAALTRACGHMIWANSAALRLAGIDSGTPDPVGGEYIRDASGDPTGVMTDAAMVPIYDAIPEDSPERVKDALAAAQRELFRFGVTSASDAGAYPDTIEIMRELYESGRLFLRLDVMVKMRDGVRDTLGEAREFFSRGIETGLYGGRFQVRALKLLADGSLGARSALLTDDYSDRPGHRGSGMFSDEELYELISAAYTSGFQASVHAIGDAANRQVLDAYGRVIRGNPPKDHRCRVEHAQILRPEDVGKFAELGVIPSMQTVHAESDANMAADRLGPERLKYAYAWRKLLGTGAVIPNGTDAPVEPADPWRALHAAVTGGGLRHEERMTREEALRSYTNWPAYASFEETAKGSLEEGKYADFIVIDRDYMTCPEDEIREIKTLKTVAAGDTVYEYTGKS
ncbi:MAG: amidohydrolase [Synergistaceae bacterium]|jgi:predicted amidohydrolase YtcJ|nr:amidohydrolase [Synergistaceae bacterium]